MAYDLRIVGQVRALLAQPRSTRYKAAGAVVGRNVASQRRLVRVTCTCFSECVQTYAPNLADGTGKLYDDVRFAAPPREETCGRSSLSLNQNSQSMAGFGSFASTFRLLDMDGYWVDIDGFQDCDSTANVIKCAQRP
ncbi:hypothetical protein [Streptomyces cadmiisoli]|uniref:hypothetical protein n=1 Tax=Streptomyces cadmiisoli TaxID=2184053 RepID=UPI003668DEF4